MREHDLQPKITRRFIVTTDSDHDGPIFPNLAKDIVPTGPNQLWVSDITYVALPTRFIYVAVILDAWSRLIVGYAIGRSIDRPPDGCSLEATVINQRPPQGSFTITITAHNPPRFFRGGGGGGGFCLTRLNFLCSGLGRLLAELDLGPSQQALPGHFGHFLLKPSQPHTAHCTRHALRLALLLTTAIIHNTGISGGLGSLSSKSDTNPEIPWPVVVHHCLYIFTSWHTLLLGWVVRWFPVTGGASSEPDLPFTWPYLKICLWHSFLPALLVDRRLGGDNHCKR